MKKLLTPSPHLQLATLKNPLNSAARRCMGRKVLGRIAIDSGQQTAAPDALTNSQLATLDDALTANLLSRSNSRTAIEVRRKEGDIKKVSAVGPRWAEISALLVRLRTKLDEQNS